LASQTADSQSSGAMSPSIENTPSVATMAWRALDRCSASRAARWSVSLWANGMILAPDSWAPAQMQAWASSSMNTTSPLPAKVGITPVLAR
jgi:hypothetical protein